MSMVINGASFRCIWWWDRHFGDTEENVRTTIMDSRGLVSDNIYDMMREMKAMASGTRAENFMWIADISPDPAKRVTEQEWDRMRLIIEEKRGLKGEVYFVIEQEKADGRIHRHLVESRIDLENGRAIPDGEDAKICHAASRQICEEFGWERNISPFDKDREGPRPKRAPKRWEMYRGMQTGIDPRDIEAEVTALFRQSDNGKAFQAALEEQGYPLVTGRRGLLILDSAGDEHSLARRIDGINTKELNAFMRDVDREALPTLEQGKAQYQERKIAGLEADRATVRDEIQWEEALAKAAIAKEEREQRFIAPADRERETRAGREQVKTGQQEKEQPQQERQQPPAPELGKTQGEIRLARSLSHGPQGFADALEDRGFILSRVTPDDIKREMEQLLKEWDERRRNPQTWMEHEDGFSVLAPELQDNARRSFAEWEKQRDKNKDENKEQEQKKNYTLEDYVDYVQKKWLEGPKSQLERAAGGLAVITPFGSICTLTPRNTGLDRDELPHYLKGIDRAALLSVTDAQAVIEDLRDHRREEWLAQQPLGRTAGEIRLAYSLTQTGQEFASAIEDRGSILACMTGTDAERLNRWERQRLKEEWKAPAPEKTRNAQSRERAPEDTYRAGELVVVNQYGQIFQLTLHNTGHDDQARAEHLKDIDLAPLLSVTAAQGVMKQFQQDRREEKQQVWEQKRQGAAQEKVWPVNPPQPERKSPVLFGQAAIEAARDDRTENLTGPAAQVWQAWRQIDPAKHEKHFAALDEYGIPFSVATDAKAFAAALDGKGIAFARATKQEADRSHRQAELAKAAGNYSPRFKEGEILIVTEARPEHRRNGEITEPRSRVHKLDQSLAGKFVKSLGSMDKLQGIDATIKASDQRAQQHAADWQAIRLERATSIRRAPRTRPGNTKDNLLKRPAAILSAPASALKIIAKPAELLSNAIEGLFAPILTPAQIRDGEIAARERKAEGRDQIELSNITAQHAQERQQEEQREAARQRERERERGGRER